MELECDYSGCETEECTEDEIGHYSANASLIKKVDPPVCDSASENLHHKEIVTSQVAESEDDILLPAEIYNVSIIQNNSEMTKGNICATKSDEADVAKDRLPKLNVKRKRRRGPPLVMPKNYGTSRRDLVPLYNETRTRISKSVLCQANSFRKEPLSIDLKKFRETPAGKSVLKGRKNREKKEECISNQQLPLLPVNNNVDDNARGFDIIQRVIWTPKSAEKEDVNKNDSLLIADDAAHISDTKESVSSKSLYSNESSIDEVLMSIKAKPKRSHREEPYTIDLALEITLQNADTCSQAREVAYPKQLRNVGLKVKDGKLRGRNGTLVNEANRTAPIDKTAVGDINSKSEDASHSENATGLGDIDVSYSCFSRRQRKTRNCTETQKSLNEHFEGGRRDVVSHSKSNVKSQSHGSEVTWSGNKDLGLEEKRGRETRSSKSALRDSAKDVVKTKALHRARNPTTKAKKCHSNQDNEKSLGKDGKRSRRDGEAVNVKAYVSRKVDRKLSSKQDVEKKKTVHQSSKHQESTCDNDEVCNPSKEINNESIALSKPRRARKKPCFYNSTDSSFLELSGNRQKSVTNPSVKSHQKSKRKAQVKSTTRSGKQLDKKMCRKAKVSGTFVVDTREAESVENPKSKGSVKAPCANDESISNAAEDDHELVCHQKEKDVCKVGDVEFGEEKQPCEQEFIISDCRTTERRGRIVSSAPSLIIISEGEENSKMLSSPDVEATDVKEANEQNDVETLSQNCEGSLSLRRKRRGWPRKELISTKKRDKTKSSFEVIDSDSRKDLTDIVDAVTEDVGSEVKIDSGKVATVLDNFVSLSYDLRRVAIQRMLVSKQPSIYFQYGTVKQS